MSSYIDFIVNDEELLEKITDIAFKSVDTDNSTFINLQELKKVMAQISCDMGAEPPTEEDVKEVLKQLDEDHNGELDVHEFKNLIKNILTALAKE